MSTRRASKRRRTVQKEEAAEDRKKQQVEEEEKEAEVNGSSKNKSPVVVFAHGAGAPSTSDWMIRSSLLYAISLLVTCFNILIVICILIL